MKLSSHERATKALTFWQLLVVIAAIAILLAAFLPALLKARTRASRTNCTNHQKQVGLAFKVWAMDHNDQYPYQVSVTNGGTMEFVGTSIGYVHFRAMSNELSTPRILVCPADTNRLAAMNWNILRDRHLSYFVGLDANDTHPQMILSGDDNFTINGARPGSGLVSFSTNDAAAWLPNRHINQGNVLLGDGSVQGFSTPRLREAFRNTGVATNRLLLP